MNMIGRLAAGNTVAGTAAAADTLSARLDASYQSTNRGRRFTVVPLGDGPGVRTSARPMLRLLSASVVVVLLIACANVASLLLARAVTRRREVAVRMAVGAGRGRLVRQWLTESVLLALMGSLGGLLIAWWGAPLLHQFDIPASINLGVTPRVFLFTFAVAVGSGVLFGLAPVLQTLRRNTVEALRDEGGAVASGVGATRMRSTFVVVQVALSLMLLVGAGLFLRTLKNATAVNLGYDIDRVLLADINMDVRGYSQDAGQAAYGAAARARQGAARGRSRRRGTRDGAERRRQNDQCQHRRAAGCKRQQQQHRRARQRHQRWISRRPRHPTAERTKLLACRCPWYATGDDHQRLAWRQAVPRR